MFPFLSVAIAAGRRLAHRLFDGKDDLKLDYENIPSVVFSHPPVGKFISALEKPLTVVSKAVERPGHMLRNASSVQATIGSRLEYLTMSFVQLQ